MEVVIGANSSAAENIVSSVRAAFDVAVVEPERVPTEATEEVDGAVLYRCERSNWPVLPILEDLPRTTPTIVVTDPTEVAPRQVYETGADAFVDGTGPDVGPRVRRRLEDVLKTMTEPGLPDRRDELVALTENAPVPIGILDADGTIRYANEAALSFVKADESDAIEGESIMSFAASDTAEDTRHRFRQVIEEREATEPMEQGFIDKDGNRRTAIVSTTPVTYQGDPAGQFVLNDITARKRRERELRQFKQAVEDAGHAIFITDLNGQITYVNQAFETITGFEASTAVGENPRILKSGKHDEQYYEQLWTTILNGEMWEREVQNARKNGEIYHAEQTISPITRDGEVTGFVAIQQDITELKEYERELENRNERLEQFASVVSHDLRNPLNVAMARVDIARNKLESDTDMARESLSETTSALHRIDQIIDDLLSLARGGQVVGNLEPALVGSVATACFSHVSHDTDTLSIEENELIVADQGRLRSLFENLFRNAIEHGGPDVSIEVGTIKEAGKIDGFYVEDDGPGIPPDERESIFELGHSSTDGGTGLGLAIVKRIAHAHGWTVTVTESAEGGARFELRGVDTPDPES